MKRKPSQIEYLLDYLDYYLHQIKNISEDSKLLGKKAQELLKYIRLVIVKTTLIILKKFK